MADMFTLMFPRTAAQLDRIEKKADQTMTAVQVQKEALDEYAQAVSDVADEIASDIEALKNAAQANEPLPQANVDSLAASLEKLKGLDVPDTEEVDEPHPDQTLPGDLPQE
jgi:gas vesicle protein